MSGSEHVVLLNLSRVASAPRRGGRRGAAAATYPSLQPFVIDRATPHGPSRRARTMRCRQIASAVISACRTSNDAVRAVDRDVVPEAPCAVFSLTSVDVNPKRAERLIRDH